MSDDDREKRIRTVAHELWRCDGKPDGLAWEHWFAAEAEIDQIEMAPPVWRREPARQA